MRPSADWYRTLYILVRSLFVLLEEGQPLKPYAILKRLKEDRDPCLRGLRQKELELILTRAAARSPHIERLPHAKGVGFCLISVPSLHELTLPTKPPVAIKRDPRFQSLHETWVAGRKALNESRDPIIAARAFGGFFPYESRKLRAWPSTLRRAVAKNRTILSDPTVAAKFGACAKKLELQTSEPLQPGAMAHAALSASVLLRADFAKLADDIGWA